MTIELASPWGLLLLPALLVPWVFQGHKILDYPYLALIPADRLSKIFDLFIKVIVTLLLTVLIFAISGPYIPEQEVQLTGKGAQIVLLLDRSRSMDQPFFSGKFTHPLGSAPKSKTKGSVARSLLSEFVAGRQNDMFGMVVFSSNPIKTLPLTQKNSVVQAAIQAGGIGKGLAETNVGAGLMKALAFFENKPYTGSRIIVLVSDGAATLNLGTRHRIRTLMQRHRVALYWIYIRTRNSIGLFEETNDASMESLAPHRALHQFFLDSDVPYRAYMAENPSELQRAIADINRLQNLPIRYIDIIPKRDLSDYFYFSALWLIAILMIKTFIEVRKWQ